MIHLRERLILGLVTIILLISAVSFITSLESHIDLRSAFYLSVLTTTISSLNIVILLSYLAFGNIGGVLFAAISVAIGSFAVIRAGLYGYMTFIIPFFLTALAGYGYNRIKGRITGAYVSKSETLEEEKNLLSNAISEKKNTIASLNKKLNRYSTLKEVTEALSGILSLEETSELIIENTVKTIARPGRALLFLVDTERQELMLSASKNTLEPLKVKAKKGDIFDHWVLRHRKSLVVEDVARDFRFPVDEMAEAREHFRSLISTPLISENRITGILRMDSPIESAYTQDDLRLLDIMSDLGAVAVQNVSLYSRIQELAIRDGLTGLFLRRYFMDRFSQEIKRAARKSGKVSLLILDIDHFKDYNDKYGHTSGDLVLKHLARLVNSAVREGDISARYGGEEMAVVLSGADKKKASLEAEAIRKKIEDNPLVLRREKMRVTVSIGVSSYPQDATLEEELIRIADERLYQAKTKGRNRVCATS